MRAEFGRLYAAGCFGACVISMWAVSVQAQVLHLEADPGDPFIRLGMFRRVEALDPGLLTRGVYVSTQVNVDASGLDVVGDAANEPSIAVDPTAPNRMIIGWRQFDTIASSFRQAGRAYSNDGGRSWTFPSVLEPGVFRSDPVVGVNGAGKFYYYSLTNNFTCQMFQSADGGVTFGSPVQAFGGDKQWFVVDTTGGVGDGHIYAMWSTAVGNWFDRPFSRSVDGGVSFQDPLMPPVATVFGTMDVAVDGRVYMAGKSSPGLLSPVFVVWSDDAQDAQVAVPGFSWSQVDVGGTLVFATGPNPGGLLGQYWVGVNKAPGALLGEVYVLASVDPMGADPCDVMFVRSVDGGATWSTPMRVNDDISEAMGWNWFGAMDVSPAGRIDVVWYDNRDMRTGDGRMSALYYSSSNDGGRSWSASVAISPVFDSHTGWPVQQKIGDYIGVVSDEVGANVAYTATFAGGEDVYYVRIGPYDCNGNGIADDIDIAQGVEADCNGNGVPDVCEIAAGDLVDADGDGVPDVCQQCPADLNGDGSVDVLDFFAFITLFANQDLAADINDDGVIDVLDFFAFITAFSAGCG